jgi:hypothetical protein
MKSTIKFFFLLILLSFSFSSAQSTIESDRWGITASFQKDQIDILIPYMFSGGAVAPIFGIVSFTDVATDLHLGLTEKIYFNSESTRPYFGLAQLVFLLFPDGGDAITDWAFGISMGGEHFFNNDFSIGISGQLNIAIASEESIRFGSPGKTNLNTAASIYATIYF